MERKKRLIDSSDNGSMVLTQIRKPQKRKFQQSTNAYLKSIIFALNNRIEVTPKSDDN